MSSMQITANGTIFNIRIDGCEGAPWLMFSNSHCTTLELWEEKVDRFKNRHHILRYDTRGHGGTSGPPGNYTQDQLAGDVAAILDALKIQRVPFCGIAVHGRFGDCVSRGDPTRTGPAFDHHRLAPYCAQPCASAAPEHVLRTAWRDRNDDRRRFCRPRCLCKNERAQ